MALAKELSTSQAVRVEDVDLHVAVDVAESETDTVIRSDDGDTTFLCLALKACAADEARPGDPPAENAADELSAGADEDRQPPSAAGGVR